MPAEVKNLVTVICDNNECKQSVFWSEGKPEDIPDTAFRILILQLFNQQKFVFCSRHCLLTFMNNDFAPVKSPREIAAEQQAAQAAAPASPTTTKAPVETTLTPVVEAPKVIPMPGEVIGVDSPEAPVVMKPKRGSPKKVTVESPAPKQAD